MDKKITYFSPSTLRICVDKVRGLEIEGRIYCRMIKEPLYFSDCTEILLKADRLFDEMKFPQSFQEKRSFNESVNTNYTGARVQPVLMISSEEMERKKGIERTLDIVVKSRKHTSWQGFVRNEKGEICGSFEGEVELLKYLVDEL